MKQQKHRDLKASGQARGAQTPCVEALWNFAGADFKTFVLIQKGKPPSLSIIASGNDSISAEYHVFLEILFLVFWKLKLIPTP